MERILFKGEIYPSKVEGLIDQLQRIDAGPRQQVWIESNGGQFEFFSVLGPPLCRLGFTSVGCDVHSAAVALHLLGHRRIALPSANFFFHEVRSLVNGGGVITICTLEEVLNREAKLWKDGAKREFIQEWYNRMRNAQGWFLQFIGQQTGMSPPIFLNLMRENAVLSAREAVRYGLVHQIMSESELLGR
jgi:ATP-dependent protease ClpP protease subunit